MKFVDEEDRNYREIFIFLVLIFMLLGALAFAFHPLSAISKEHAGTEASIEDHLAKAQLLQMNCLSIEKDIIIWDNPDFLPHLNQSVAALSVEAQLLEKLAQQAGDAYAAQKASDFKKDIVDYSNWIAKLTETYEARGINIKPRVQEDIKKVAICQEDVLG